MKNDLYVNLKVNVENMVKDFKEIGNTFLEASEKINNIPTPKTHYDTTSIKEEITKEKKNEKQKYLNYLIDLLYENTKKLVFDEIQKEYGNKTEIILNQDDLEVVLNIGKIEYGKKFNILKVQREFESEIENRMYAKITKLAELINNL